jgi:hypothetical protein
MRRRRVCIELEAQLNALQALHWYEERSPGVGAELMAEVKKTRARIAAFPLSFPEARNGRGARRALLHRFPYAMVFLIEANVIRVIAFVHVKQRPGSWRRGGRSSP